jgi:hypothetical protein
MAAKQARDAGGEKTDQAVDRTEARNDEDRSSVGAPLATQRPAMADPAPDVSNADIDIQSVSLDTGHSTHIENPDPNPNDLRPAPGPSAIEVLGVPSEDPTENAFEATREGASR